MHKFKLQKESDWEESKEKDQGKDATRADLIYKSIIRDFRKFYSTDFNS